MTDVKIVHTGSFGDYVGIYINGKLEGEDDTFMPEDLFDYIGQPYDSFRVGTYWYEYEGSLPDEFSDVVLERDDAVWRVKSERDERIEELEEQLENARDELQRLKEEKHAEGRR